MYDKWGNRDVCRPVFCQRHDILWESYMLNFNFVMNMQATFNGIKISSICLVLKHIREEMEGWDDSEINTNF